MITSTSNPRIRLVRALQTQRKARERERLFVVEGIRLAAEAAAVKAAARLVLHTESLDERARSIVNQLARLGAEVEAVSPEVMKACADTETPPGLLAVLAQPELPLPAPLTFALVLDRLANPGNLGSVLRAAAAAGVEAAFLTPGSVDAFNPKVVRGAMGAHFHLPIRKAAWEELRAALQGLHVWLASAREGERHDAVDWRERSALILGSEAEGPGDEARALAMGSVHIPMAGGVESLNAAVAAGVLLFEAARQRETMNDER